MAVAAAALAVGLAACGGGGSSSSSSSSSGGETSEGGGSGGEPVKIAVILKDAAAPYWHFAEEGAEEGAAALGSKAEVSYVGVKSEEDAPGQISAIENAVTGGAKGIVIAPTVPEALIPILEKVSGEGVKVIVIDQKIEGFEATSTISTNNVKGGELGATAMLEALKQGEVGIISGPPGLEGTDERAEGFVNGVKGKLDVVAELPSPCDTPTGVKDAENMITAHPHIAAIYSVCGLPALGAVQAVKGAGLLGKITLVGWDANTSEAQLENIESGIEFAGVAQHPEFMGKTGVEYAYKASMGESVPTKVESPTSLITKANVAEYK
jgi:ABC-type sugar transport system substrate-binding protein